LTSYPLLVNSAYYQKPPQPLNNRKREFWRRETAVRNNSHLTCQRRTITHARTNTHTHP